MNQPVDVLSSAGIDQPASEFRVDAGEPAAVSPALIQDADQVDDRLLTRAERREHGGIVDVGCDQAKRRDRRQMPGTRGIAGRDCNAPTVARKRRGEMSADKARAAQHADRSRRHRAIIRPRPGAPDQRSGKSRTWLPRRS